MNEFEKCAALALKHIPSNLIRDVKIALNRVTDIDIEDRHARAVVLADMCIIPVMYHLFETPVFENDISKIINSYRKRPFFTDFTSFNQRVSVDDKKQIIHSLINSLITVLTPKRQKKEGVVFTPHEIVDFMIRTCNDICVQEFGVTLNDAKILDPFSGIGTYIGQLIESDIIQPRLIAKKLNEDIKSHEIDPMSWFLSLHYVNIIYYLKYREHHLLPNFLLKDTFYESHPG